MTRFRVIKEKGFWDGVNFHKTGVLLDINPKDFDVLLRLGLEPLDEDGKKEMLKRFGARSKIAPSEIGSLDPSNPKDRREMFESLPHATVIEDAPAAKPTLTE